MDTNAVRRNAVYNCIFCCDVVNNVSSSQTNNQPIFACQYCSLYHSKTLIGRRLLGGRLEHGLDGGVLRVAGGVGTGQKRPPEPHEAVRGPDLPSAENNIKAIQIMKQNVSLGVIWCGPLHRLLCAEQVSTGRG